MTLLNRPTWRRNVLRGDNSFEAVYNCPHDHGRPCVMTPIKSATSTEGVTDYRCDGGCIWQHVIATDTWIYLGGFESGSK